MKTIKQNGITLIALVITIIVLLILAGVSIATLTGENGILTRANDAKTSTEIAEEKEKVELATVAAYTDAKGGELQQNVLEQELGKYFTSGKYNVTPGTNEDGTEGYIVTITENDQNGRKYFVDKNGNVTEYTAKEPEETPEDATVTELSQMKYGVIEIEFLTGTSYNVNDTKAPNDPSNNMTSDMKKVYWENGEEKVEGESADFDASKWYSYTAQTGDTTVEGTSHWANVIVTKDGVESYFVWIPRYAYRIIYFDSPDNENAYRTGTLTEEQALENGNIVGYSDARGIVTADGKKPTGVDSQTAISVNNKYFKTHPAFEGDVSYGGWTNEEGNPQKLEGIWVAKYEASQLSGTNTPKFEPGVSSWRSITIGNMYTYAQAYNPTLNSHLMKNSEWGAVAYLTESKYGRNGTEITINSNNGYYTAGASGATPTTNKLQSTTGNEYGIYDLSGGAYEYVASYYNGSNSLSNGSSFANKGGTSTKYATAYIGTTAKSSYKYGDATYETSGWNSDYAYFVRSSYPFFVRGGYCDSTSNAGVFYFFYNSGNGGSSNGFRVCLAV